MLFEIDVRWESAISKPQWLMIIQAVFYIGLGWVFYYFIFFSSILVVFLGLFFRIIFSTFFVSFQLFLYDKMARLREPTRAILSVR